MIQQNFPVPRFSADSSWPNRWNLSNTTATSVGLKGPRRIALKKTEKYTVHAILNGEAGDLNVLSEGHGVPVSADTAYLTQISGDRTGDLRIQLAIHEFTAEGGRIGRDLVDLDSPALYVPRPGTERLILTVRMRGWGSFTIRGLDFEPVPGVHSAEPGLHPLEAPEPQEHLLDAENFADLKQIMLHSPAFHERLAEAAGARMEQSLAELRIAEQETRRSIAELAARSEQTLAALEDIQSRLAARELRDAFSGTGIEVLSETDSSASRSPGRENLVQGEGSSSDDQ